MFLNAIEKETTGPYILDNENNPAKLNQPVPFKDVFTTEYKPCSMLHLVRGFAFVSRGDKLSILSKLIKIRFKQNRSLYSKRIVHQTA